MIRQSIFHSALWLSIGFTAVSCGPKKDGGGFDPTPRQITAKPAGEGLLDIEASLSDSSATIHIGHVPEQAELECKLDGQVLETCHDGMVLSKLDKGDHSIRIIASRDKSIVSVGELAFRIGDQTTVKNESNDDQSSEHPLTLVANDPTFKNGMAINMNKTYTAKFKFLVNPNCNVKVRCSFGSPHRDFWHECTTNHTEVIPKGLMPKGLQYLTMQAQCGDLTGPRYTMYWYGVGDNYQPLQLEAIPGESERSYTFSLVKGNDCYENLLKYECAVPGSDQFSACSNTQHHVTPGFKVRATCNDQVGPILTFTTGGRLR